MVEIHELRVIKRYGGVDSFPVTDGDLSQAQLRASLSQHPGDVRVAVTEHAFIRMDSVSFDAEDEGE